ncbi:MAG: ATP-binding cassette domain-containing protein [Clostridium fessum]
MEDFSIIDHLSFEVQDGEFVSVIGASGCGKSTIFRLVNKLLTAGFRRDPGGWRVHRNEEKLLWIYAAAGSVCFHGGP